MDRILLVILAFGLADANYPSPCYSCSSGCSTCHAEQNPIDCEWSPWRWGSCSVTCGKGRQTATRYVLRPSQNNGQPCGSVARASRDCSGPECPVDCVWGHWSSWGCSVTCGEGRQFRTRAVGIPASPGGRECEGNSYFVGGSCYSGCCPLDCEWSAWSWGSCDVSCGGGSVFLNVS